MSVCLQEFILVQEPAKQVDVPIGPRAGPFRERRLVDGADFHSQWATQTSGAVVHEHPWGRRATSTRPLERSHQCARKLPIVTRMAREALGPDPT